MWDYRFLAFEPGRIAPKTAAQLAAATKVVPLMSINHRKDW